MEQTHSMSPPEYRKVAAVGVSFWLLKILTTTLGDVSGDALSIALHLGYAISLAAMIVGTAALLGVQLRSKRWRPWLYWTLMLGSSALGAELSDGLSRALRWGSATTSIVLLGCLVATLAAWSLGQGMPRADAIASGKNERMYWIAAILANSFGSALGDLLGDRMGLGLVGTTSIYACVLAMLWGVHKTTRVDRQALFWTAFTVSRIPF